MVREIACFALVVTSSLTLATRALGQDHPAAALTRDSGPPLLATNARLLESLDRITRGSALWRTDVRAVLGTGGRVVVVTPEHVIVADSRHMDAPRPFDSTVLAEVAFLTDDSSRITAVVVVNLPLLDTLHDRSDLLKVQRDADLDRILVHEVYGHAFPYLIAGDASGRCPDPTVGQRPADACSIRRENAVRAELGLGRRIDYGLTGLTLGWASESRLNASVLAQRLRY
jgi:hypothetical protein